MGTIAEEGSRALEAGADLVDLLRLAHEAVHRIEQDVHAETFIKADALSGKLHNLRKEADALNEAIIKSVQELESQAYS